MHEDGTAEVTRIICGTIVFMIIVAVLMGPTFLRAVHCG